MPKMKRHRTDYPGVYYVIGRSVRGKPEKIFYIRYWRNGKQVDEKAGRQFKDDMTASKAATLRGKRAEGELTNKEKREALRKQKEAEKGKWTIDRLFEEYAATRPDNKSNSVDRSRYNKYLKDYFGSKEVEQIVPLDTERIRVQLLKKKAPQTVKSVLELLSRTINFGVRQNFCFPLPFKIRKPKVSNITIEDLSCEQLQALLKAIAEEPNIQVANTMRLVLYTGMRTGETFRLRWEDIDFERGFITLKDPKGGTDQRIPMNQAARKVLESHPRISEFVFPGRGGKQRTNIYRLTRAIADKASLPRTFRPLYGLRHYFATNLASSGEVDMYTLQRLLTHKDPRMTQRYAHLRDEALRRASELAGQIVTDVLKNARDEAEKTKAEG